MSHLAVISKSTGVGSAGIARGSGRPAMPGITDAGSVVSVIDGDGNIGVSPGPIIWNVSWSIGRDIIPVDIKPARTRATDIPGIVLGENMDSTVTI